MLLRNSISNTKKFFQKTVDNVKSFLSKGSTTTYERLPKTPPFRPFSCGHTHTDGDAAGYHNNNTELDHFYTEFTHQWDNSRKISKLKNKAQKIKSSIRASSSSTTTTTTTRKNQQFYSFGHSSLQENCSSFNDSMKTPEKKAEEIMKGKRMNVRSAGIMQYSDLCSKSVRERRLSCVAEKLKELENMDKGNSDHKRDVEEFLQCYSRLTCPAYLDIVDKFLKEMSAEFFGPHQASPKVNYSRPLWKAVKV